MKTIDYKFSELCTEIDYWKDEAKYWESKYKEERDLNIQQTKERLEHSEKGVANALMFAMGCVDLPDGSIKISKEKRKELSENWKT